MAYYITIGVVCGGSVVVSRMLTGKTSAQIELNSTLLLLALIGVVTDRFGILSSCWVFSLFLCYIFLFAVIGSRRSK